MSLYQLGKKICDLTFITKFKSEFFNLKSIKKSLTLFLILIKSITDKDGYQSSDLTDMEKVVILPRTRFVNN